MKTSSKNILNICLLVLPVLFLSLVVSLANAQMQPTVGIQYPITELGNCTDKAICATYCDKSENMSACVDFASKQGMISDSEAGVAKKAIEKIKSGQTPGGCNSKESCQAFCQNNISSLNACIGFAKEVGIADDEINQAQKIAAALEKGASLPGGCQGKASCESYCADTSHIDECLVFAEAAQILPADEIVEAKKVAKFIKSGETPGKCKSKDECKAYCDNDVNFTECLGFAEKAQLVSQEEIDMARKTGGKGPGDCKSKTTCEAYCNDPQNAKQCADFAIEKNLLSSEEMDNIKNGVSKIKSGLEQVPADIKPDVESCLNNLLGGNLNKVLSGEQALTKAQGDKIGACFEDAAKKYAEEQMQQGLKGAGGVGGGGGQQGPSNEQMNALKNAPPEVQQQVQQQIQSQMQASGAPSGGSAPPSGAPSGPPSGIQGPPCNSPAECQAMFGGGGPPAGIPR